MTTLLVKPAATALRGQLRPPSDKSISHRAALFALLSGAESRIRGYLGAEDTLATLKVCQQLGAEVSVEGDDLRIRGRGLNRLVAPTHELDCGNSGTAMRLLSGILSSQPFPSILTGDDSLNGRPMGRIIQPLQQMGARIQAEQGHAPIVFEALNGSLRNQRFDLPVASAQVKSCLLLAGLFGEGTQSVREPGPSRDHTERMLRSSGVRLQRNEDGWLSLEGHVDQLEPLDIEVPADPSSAAFLMGAALVVPDSEVHLTDVGINPTRTGLFDALNSMGVSREMTGNDDQGAAEDSQAEPVADLAVRHQTLQGIDIPIAWVPRMIDELPLLLALAVLAEGTTRVRGAAELRVKESDRLAAMAAGFDALGIDYQIHEDGMDVPGLGPDAQIAGGEVDARGDHRIAMSFAVLGLRASAPLKIHNAQMIATSYPDFPGHLQSLGAEVRFA